MIKKKSLLFALLLLSSFVLVACDLTPSITTDTTASSTLSTTSTTTTTTSTASTATTSNAPYYIGTFTLDDHVSVTVYPTQDYTDGEETTLAYAKDSDTGEVLNDGEGQINFTVSLEDGYGILSLIVTPSENYNSFKTAEELELENTYRITKITGDITITITTYVLPTEYNPNESTMISLNNSSATITNNNGGASFSNGILTIALGGNYVISGSLSEGQILVNAPDTDVYLYFLDLTISSTLYAPVYIEDANNTDIWIEELSTVTLNDNRPSSTSAEDPGAALFSSCDLTIDGDGDLVINANYNNGITSSDDLKIKNISLEVIANNNGIKGNDSLTISSGTVNITAKTGDGLKTENSDISDKSVQRGVLTISGGTITINAAGDGIDSAYDVIVKNDPILKIYTSSTYATGLDGSTQTTSDTLYLRISSAIYSSSYRYSVLFSNPSTTETEWEDASYIGSAYVSGRLYYFYSLDLPSGYTTYTLYRFTSSSSNSTTSYNAKSETASLNTYNDMLVVGSSGIVGTTITVSWSIFTYTSSSSTEYSTKGIKAANNVYIFGGDILIYSYDDGIHANNDTLLDNSSYGEGSIYITGGTMVITSKDDGIHGDKYVDISGGSISILTSYEGIEGNQIKISEGTVYVIATDDGLNAYRGSLSAAIYVSGGYVDISVGTGDTDAIDSNGTYTQTGGFVVSRSALSGGMGGALDTESTVSITGGTFIGIGSSERVATSSGSNRSTGLMSITVSGGTYVLKDSQGNEILTFTTSSSYTYRYMWISSELLSSGTSYTLYRDGTSVKTWTQS